MGVVYLFSVWLHIFSAAVWIGGMVFLAAVLVPVTRRPEYRGVAASLFHLTGLRFRWVGWVCIALLLLTGTFNLFFRGFGWADLWSGRLWEGSFGHALAIKLLFVMVISLLSVLHDFLIGPRATRLWQANPGSTDAQRLRRQASLIGRANLLLALATVALGTLLVRGFFW